MQKLTTDLCIIGAGAAGLALAAGAVRLGAKVVVAEAGEFGGAHPLALARQVLRSHARRIAHDKPTQNFDARAARLQATWREVKSEIRVAQARFSPLVRRQRYEAMGVKIIPAQARFVGARLVEAGGYEILARKFAVATGARLAEPKIMGLELVRYHTCESIFNLEELPSSIAILSDSAVGVEMAQSLSRLGVRVALIAPNGILEREDTEVVHSLQPFLRADGIDLRFKTPIERIELEAQSSTVAIFMGDGQTIQTSQLLLAARRQPNIENLGLQRAGAAFENGAPKLDAQLRTTNKKIYILGSAAGANSLHASRRQALIVLKNVFFSLTTRENYSPVVRYVASDPELAAIGMTEEQVRLTGVKFKIFRAPMSDIDSAVLNGEGGGAIKIISSTRGKILGCAVLAPRAGELIVPWIMAMDKNLPISDMAEIFAPYPAYSQVIQQAAAEFYADKMNTFWVRFGLWLGKRL